MVEREAASNKPTCPFSKAAFMTQPESRCIPAYEGLHPYLTCSGQQHTHDMCTLQLQAKHRSRLDTALNLNTALDQNTALDATPLST